MEEFQFKSPEYLNRINFQGEMSVSAEVLTALHNAQFRSIAFENFDICLNRPIELSPSAIFNKLVRHSRGGYCFELNGLLLMALKHYGYHARALLARVHISGTPTGRSHQLSLVSLNNAHWIVDAGFGADTPQRPIPLLPNRTFETQAQILRIVEDELFGYMLQSRKCHSWINLYSFELNHVCDADIVYANHYTSTHPQSHFVCNRYAALPLDNGSVTLVNFTLKKTIGSKQFVQDLEPGQVYLDALKEHFGIVLENHANLKAINEASIHSLTKT